MATWREDLTEALRRNGETWQDVEAHTLTEEQLNGDSFAVGLSFTLWTKNNVYFPGTYDAAVWVESVPRNPNGEATSPVGG